MVSQGWLVQGPWRTQVIPGASPLGPLAVGPRGANPIRRGSGAQVEAYEGMA